MELEELVAEQLRHLNLLEIENSILQRKVADAELELAVVATKLRRTEQELGKAYAALGKQAAAGNAGGEVA